MDFSVPSGLKAWIDQIVRLGVTFDFFLDNGIAQYRPLLRGKFGLSRGYNAISVLEAVKSTPPIPEEKIR